MLKRIFFLFLFLLSSFYLSASQASGYYPNGSYSTVFSGDYAAYFPYGRSEAKKLKIQKTPIKNTSEKVKVLSSKQKNEKKKRLANRKNQFIDKVLPLIVKSNQELTQLRSRILKVCGDSNSFEQLSVEQQKWLKQLGNRYKAYQKKSDFLALRKELLNRVNSVDPALALAQAALESGWGSSRFTREANNIFGIWTYNKSIGLVPKNRDISKKHFIRVFADLDESVSHYMYNLNTHSAYEKFRNIRALQDYIYTEKPTYLQLDGLEKYSGLGQEYLKRIKKVIKFNNLIQVSQNYIDRLNKLNGLALSNTN